MHDFTDFPSAKFHKKFEHNTSIGVAMKTFGTEFENFTVRGRFSKKKQI